MIARLDEPLIASSQCARPALCRDLRVSHRRWIELESARGYKQHLANLVHLRLRRPRPHG
jgi:hypothetical protein